MNRVLPIPDLVSQIEFGVDGIRIAIAAGHYVAGLALTGAALRRRWRVIGE
jgi:hypothetical protein